MPDTRLQLVLELPPGSDPETLPTATRGLVEELEMLDLTTEAPSAAPPPEGTRAVDPQLIGSVIVALGAAGGLLPKLASVLETWVKREPGRKMTITTKAGTKIVIVGQSSKEIQAALQAIGPK